ncbi:unnamed protein product, partial [Staurois parvus]
RHTYLHRFHSIFTGPLSSASSPVIGRLCAFPELQFWRPITGEEAEPSSRAKHPVDELNEGAAALPGLDHRGTGARAAVLNLWVATPLGVKQPFHRGLLRPSE